MDRLIFGHSFAEVVALILLPGIAFYFLNKKKASSLGDPEDSDTDTPGSSTTPTATNSGGSSSTPPETADGASSSSASPSGDCYEVFLSFSGRDTRHGFTDHLYHGLVDARIQTFRDNEELRRGKKIGDDLFAAIKKSKILIPILSVNYGKSSWCLNELVQIMECKKKNKETIVLPIFYKVEPSDVGHLLGSFGDEFRKREERLRERRGFDPTILKKWKEALEEVSKLKGHCATGPEGELVKSVVREVLSELIAKFELDIPENLIGIGSHVEKVVTFVANNSRATLLVGIHGMGGIGKTTLAKTIYNQLLSQFQYHSFVADIREKYKNGVEHLQNKLIHDILKKKNLARNRDEGIKLLSSRFKETKVLILLDDVDADAHLEDLAGDRAWFSSGSVIIITTRDKSILDKARVDHEHDHRVLDKDSSLILFSRHAFRNDAPPSESEFQKLTDEVVSTTGGLPLSLKVLGSFLCGKPPGVWEGTIQQLRNAPHKEVQQTLRISYEALEYEEKQIFLDIACFFIGTDLRIASYMWDACGFSPEKGIVVLRLMSLIKVEEDQELRMHDQLRDFGRLIVREENMMEHGKRSRLWDFKEAVKVLENDEGTSKIEAISCSKSPSHQDGNKLTGEQFKELKNLRFLDARGAHFSGDFKNPTKNLKWLRWRNCPSTFEADNFHAKELVVLDLSRSNLSDTWSGWSSIKMARKLKYLDLTHCQSLEGTSFLSYFEKLEVLILVHCRKLKQLDSSIGKMKSLVRLDLTGCCDLKRLPPEVGKLEALEQLLLRRSRIEELPESIGNLQNLEILDISFTQIKELPNGIGRLRKLRDLDASGCGELEGEMPESIRSLSSLQRLDLHSCRKLRLPSLLPSSLTYLRASCQNSRLPSLSNLTHLKEVRLFDFKFVECIREQPSTLLETPSELEILEIVGCSSIKRLDLPKSKSLKKLIVKVCKNLVEIQGLDLLESLERIDISECASIERLNLPKSKGLKIFKAANCKSLVEIQGLNTLESLEEIGISECTAIERLNLSKSKGLKKFKATDFESLIEIQGLDRWESLEEIDISKCALIERLNLSKSKGLKKFKAANCKSLVEIQGLDTLESLEEIHVSKCASIERLNLSKSKGLEIFRATDCKSLVEIQDLDTLESLKVINISECAAIERLNLSKYKGLKIFRAANCKSLVEIQGLDTLESLKVINISECAAIERLNLSKSKGLEIFRATDCKSLVEIQGLDTLESLEEIEISECAAIERLNLSKSKGLEIFRATDCKSLVEIQGLDTLESLERIDISKCASIERLNLSKSEGLKKFKAADCKSLIEIQGLDTLESLEEIDISKWASIERLNLSKSEGLKIFKAADCKSLVEIQGLDTLESLEEIDVSECASIERLNLSKSKGLKKLSVGSCQNLFEIQGLDRLKFLKVLNLSGCTSYGSLPNMCCFDTLCELAINCCDNLHDIQGLERFPSRTSLSIQDCNSLANFPNLSNFLNLEKLYLSNCHGLREIPWLVGSKSLLYISISGCSSVEILPDLSSCTNLKSLVVRNCEKLTELRGLEKLVHLRILDISGCKSLKTIPELPGINLFRNYEQNPFDSY